MCTEAKDKNPIDYDKLIQECREESLDARKEIISILKSCKKELKNARDRRELEILTETKKIRQKYESIITGLITERDTKRKILTAFEKKRGVNLKRLQRQKKSSLYKKSPLA